MSKPKLTKKMLEKKSEIFIVDPKTGDWAYYKKKSTADGTWKYRRGVHNSFITTKIGWDDNMPTETNKYDPAFGPLNYYEAGSARDVYLFDEDAKKAFSKITGLRGLPASKKSIEEKGLGFDSYKQYSSRDIMKVLNADKTPVRTQKNTGSKTTGCGGRRKTSPGNTSDKDIRKLFKPTAGKNPTLKTLTRPPKGLPKLDSKQPVVQKSDYVFKKLSSRNEWWRCKQQMLLRKHTTRSS